MRAIAVIPKKEGSAHLREVNSPIPQEGEVLVRVLEVGIDATDREINAGQYGEAPEGEDFLILGHESLGRVESIGTGVEEFRPDGLVVATVRRPGDCSNCRLGELDMCLCGRYKERGIKQLHGFLSEYYVERPEYLIKVPDNLKEIAVILEPLSIAEKAIRQIFKIQERMYWEPKKALILGGGPIGLLSMILCRLRDLETYVLDRGPKGGLKSRLVEENGSHFLNAEEHQLSDLPGKLGNIDLIIEATGNSKVTFDAMCIFGINGVLCLLGVYESGRTLEVTPDCIGLQMVLGNRLIFGSVNAHKSDFEAGVNDLTQIESRWPGWLKKLITRRLPFERFQEGLKKGKDEIKTVLELSR